LVQDGILYTCRYHLLVPILTTMTTVARRVIGTGTLRAEYAYHTCMRTQGLGLHVPKLVQRMLRFSSGTNK